MSEFFVETQETSLLECIVETKETNLYVGAEYELPSNLISRCDPPQ